METLHNIIGGAAAKSTSPRSAPVFNSATGEQSAILPLSTAAELDAAVAAAKLALPEWAATPPLGSKSIQSSGPARLAITVGQAVVR